MCGGVHADGPGAGGVQDNGAPLGAKDSQATFSGDFSGNLPLRGGAARGNAALCLRMPPGVQLGCSSERGVVALLQVRRKFGRAASESRG